jgi:hypothetical protein
MQRPIQATLQSEAQHRSAADECDKIVVNTSCINQDDAKIVCLVLSWID